MGIFFNQKFIILSIAGAFQLLVLSIASLMCFSVLHPLVQFSRNFLSPFVSIMRFYYVVLDFSEIFLHCPVWVIVIYFICVF